MQRKKHLLIVALAPLLLLICCPARAEQDADEVLKLLARGDALYQSHQYVEAFGVYRVIYEEKGQYTPQMLLKMASVQEGIGDYAKTLYFLTENYKATYDKRVREKILSLVDAHALRGHAFGDRDHFMRAWYRFRTPLLAVFSLLSLCLLGCVVLWRLSKKGHSGSMVAVMRPLVFSALFSIFLLFGDLLFHQSHGILAEDALVLQAPSAAAVQVADCSSGDRVIVEERGTVWTKIRWCTPAGTRGVGYVRTKALLFFS